MSKIKLAISSCLLGQRVRYDGGHKRDAYINATLAEYFDFISVCPEVAIGLATPRSPICLVQVGDEIRVQGREDHSVDVTEALHRYGKSMVQPLEAISGYILKKGSPSCGPEQVEVVDQQGQSCGKAAGAFAHSLQRKFPLLPMVDEEQLGEAALRDNFIMRVFVYHRWQQMLADGLSVERLQAFHADHQYLVLSHNPAAYKHLAEMLVDIDADSVKVVSCLYMEEMMSALKHPASRVQHATVLLQLLAHLEKQIDSGDRAELLAVIEQYREGMVPLLVPMTLLNHHFRRHPHDEIERQLYLNPHPQELMLRNLN